MITIKEYLEYIQEQRDKEIGKGGIKRKPSPTFAYELVYGKSVPGDWRSGRYIGPHKTRLWNGMEVDAHLKDKWLSDLNKIPNVEIRGTCEGHDDDWPTYISFRVDPKYDKNKSFLNKVVKNLNRDKNTKCGWDLGTQDRPRLVCSAPLYYGCKKQNEWTKWWITLPSRLNKAVNV